MYVSCMHNDDFGVNHGFCKEKPSLASLIASIEFNDSFRLKTHSQWAYESSMRSEGSIDSRTVRIGPCICKLCLFKPTHVFLGLTPILSASKFAKCVIRLTQCTQCYLERSYTLMVLKLYG